MSPKPRARNTDPTTSKAAADSVAVTDATATQLAILAILDTYGASTDEQIAEAYDVLTSRRQAPRVSPSGLRTRRAELVTAGLVVDSGVKGTTRAGRSCIVWTKAAR